MDRVQIWDCDPDRIDALSDAKIILDCIEKAGETRVTTGEVTMLEVPSFIKNRYPEYSAFIMLLMEAKRLKSIQVVKEVASEATS